MLQQQQKPTSPSPQQSVFVPRIDPKTVQAITNWSLRAQEQQQAIDQQSGSLNKLKGQMNSWSEQVDEWEMEKAKKVLPGVKDNPSAALKTSPEKLINQEETSGIDDATHLLVKNDKFTEVKSKRQERKDKRAAKRAKREKTGQQQIPIIDNPESRRRSDSTSSRSVKRKSASSMERQSPKQQRIDNAGETVKERFLREQQAKKDQKFPALQKPFGAGKIQQIEKSAFGSISPTTSRLAKLKNRVQSAGDSNEVIKPGNCHSPSLIY
jgi:hypothetical protein